ncbi:MAG TPA: 3-hydroxyacyl-CoA dehydrogenase, partial [Hellea balneolensis]|nr:3-hydroxyacyl-CoA dehydrogenase [Hellea balneolensis]
MFSKTTQIGICGAGAMGAGIAQIAASAGHHVVVLDRDEAALERGRNSVAKGAAALLKRGKISAEDADNLQSRITWTLDINDLSRTGLVIEAIVENLEIKRVLFQKLENIVPKNTVLATNTSSLSVTQISVGLERPQKFIGLNFFNPAPIMKLVEVISGLNSDAKIVSSALSLMQ